MSQLLDKYLSIVKKFIPEKTVAPSVGIDIGVQSCRMIELVKSGDSFEILNWAIEPIKKDDVAGAIKALLEGNNIESKSPYTAVFGKGTLIRYIDMPKMALDDLKKSFDIESDKYFPFPQEQIYTDCYILDPKGQDKKMSVLVAAAKRELINDRVALLTGLDLQPGFIGINPIAIANVYHVLGEKELPEETSKEDSSVTAILDMGEAVCNLIILKDNVPRFTRDIFVGGQELDKRIANVLGVSAAEAEKLKCQPGDKLEEVFNACESVLMNLVSEVRLSFDYFITEKNLQVSKVFITGGTSLLEGLEEFLKKQLDLPVECWNPIGCCKLAEGVSSEEINKNASKLGVALGLALYHFE